MRYSTTLKAEEEFLSFSFPLKGFLNFIGILFFFAALLSLLILFFHNGAGMVAEAAINVGPPQPW